MGERDEKGRFAPKGNTYIFKDNVFVFDSSQNLLFFTDKETYEKIKNFCWHKNANGYTTATIDGKEVFAHRFIIGAKKGEIVDHKNGNKKDNTRENLRICTKSQNAYNSKKRINNTSGYTGVYLRKDTGKWAAEIKKDNKKISLGCFASKEGAISARKAAEEKYIKEFVSYEQ